MYNLTFDFDVQKLVQSIAFFSHSRVPELTKLKIAKLLYFADKEHLLHHGAPIIGDVYFCMDYGPVPSLSLNEMSAAATEPEVRVPETGDADLFSKVLNVRKLFYKYPRFAVREGAYNPAVFAESELSALRYTVNMYGHKSAKELVDITHREPTWRIPNQGRPKGSRALITYDLFFEGASEQSRRFLGKLVADQYGVTIPLAGDADYRAFGHALSSTDFISDEFPESDTLESSARVSRA
jgi:uncharacterized phage-associated protein